MESVIRQGKDKIDYLQANSHLHADSRQKQLTVSTLQSGCIVLQRLRHIDTKATIHDESPWCLLKMEDSGPATQRTIGLLRDEVHRLSNRDVWWNIVVLGRLEDFSQRPVRSSVH